MEQPLPLYGGATRVVTRFATPAVCSDLYLIGGLQLIVLGLYHKLHGVHRPVAMKKSVIKRRKRVVPAPQGTQASGFDISENAIGSPEPHVTSPAITTHDQRGTINSDGSVNLGFRPRHEPRLLPEPSNTPLVDSQQQQLPSLNSASYPPSQGNIPQDQLSLNNDNRLPPMASYLSPRQRPPSLSPNSFLSPSRKRSFTAAETEPSVPPVSESNSKRLSSIKSILNPSQQSCESNESLDPSLRMVRSPEGRYATAPPSSSYANSQANSWENTSGPSSARDVSSETDRAKIERRAELQREAERIREALRAKERELEELNA